MVRSAGHSFDVIQLFEAYSGEPYDENRDDWDTTNIVKVVISRIRKKIKAVDPGFDGLKRVNSGIYSWDDGQVRDVLKRGRITLRLKTGEILWDGEKVRVTPSSYRLIEFLVKSNKVATFEELYKIHSRETHIQKSEGKIIKVLNTKIYRIRLEFEKMAGGLVEFLKPVTNVGYIWQD